MMSQFFPGFFPPTPIPLHLQRLLWMVPNERRKLANCEMHAEKISPPQFLLAIFHPFFNTNLKFLGLFGLPPALPTSCFQHLLWMAPNERGKLAYCVMHAEKISPPRLLLAIFHPFLNANLKFLGLFGLPSLLRSSMRQMEASCENQGGRK